MKQTKRPLAILATLLTLFTSAIPAFAIFVPVELIDVPVKRLVANLESMAKEKPEDAKVQLWLARVHAMAYAKDLGKDGKLQTKDGANEPWFGHTPAHVPYAPHRRNTKGKPGAEAKANLKLAIGHYRKALKLEPGNTTSLLGLSWCLEQAGDNDAAIKGYRAVIAKAWAKEGKAQFGGLTGFVAVEAIGYLLPLLDETKDAKEIDDLKKKRKKLATLPRPVTPVVIPLQDEVGVNDIIDPVARVRFDLDGTGRQLSWQWIDPAHAGWLVHDPRRTGAITSAIQMFGTRSFLMFFEHGYEALSLLDNDRDGALRGKELAGLAIWHDRDADGVSDDGEVRPLGDYEITGLSCKSTTNADGLVFSPGGVTFKDGTHRDSYDVVLERAEIKAR